MLWKLNSCVIFSLLWSFSSALNLPPYIKACPLNDPNLNECATKHAQEAIPGFINGDRKYKVPNLNPLIIPSMEINQGTEQVGLKIKLKNTKFFHLKDTKVESIKYSEHKAFCEYFLKEWRETKKMKISNAIGTVKQSNQSTCNSTHLLLYNKKNFKVDMKNQIYHWDLSIPIIEAIADYNVTGKILLLPIFGSGLANITLDKPRFKYIWKYTLYQKNGEEYVMPQKGSISYKLKKAYIYLENLFNGDKLLGTQMNRFLNENWEDAVKEIGPSFAEALSQVMDSILKNICDTVPYRLIFV